MAFEKARAYYFRIGADQSRFGFEFVEIPAGRAREMIKALKQLE